MSYDLLYGRTGFLWAALFINNHIGEDTIPMDILMPIVEAVLAGGRAGASDHTASPLMYRWHGTRYWGAAHGLAGILQVLLHFSLSDQDVEDVKGTLRYMMSNRFPHSGNYPTCEGNQRDRLIQWSHGATGITLTLSKASQVRHSLNFSSINQIVYVDSILTERQKLNLVQGFSSTLVYEPKYMKRICIIK